MAAIVLFGPRYFLETGIFPPGTERASPGQMLAMYPGSENHQGKMMKLNKISSKMVSPRAGELIGCFTQIECNYAIKSKKIQ